MRRTAGLPTASEPPAAMELPSAELPATATQSCEPAAKRPCQDATSAAALDVETSDEAGAAGPAEARSSGRANLGKIDRFVDSKLVTEEDSYWRQSLGSRHERTRALGESYEERGESRDEAMTKLDVAQAEATQLVVNHIVRIPPVQFDKGGRARGTTARSTSSTYTSLSFLSEVKHNDILSSLSEIREWHST